jgi:hypothetical protein
MSQVTAFLENIGANFLQQEETAVLPILAATAANIAKAPTKLNFLAQSAMALAAIEATQPQILANEAEQVVGFLTNATAAVVADLQTKAKAAAAAPAPAAPAAEPAPAAKHVDTGPGHVGSSATPQAAAPAKK